MDKTAITFAKLAGLQKMLNERLAVHGRFFDPPSVLDYFERFNTLREQLIEYLPELYNDLPEREIPKSSETTDYDGRGYIDLNQMMILKRDLDYIFEVRANSRLGEKRAENLKKEFIFISHGSSKEWYKVQTFLEKDINFSTIELAQQPNLGRTVLQKLDEESDKCHASIIVMTGDDIIEHGEVRARENVLHEIGFFQGKLGLDRIVLLHEEGVNISSNIDGLVYISFPKDTVEATFGALQKELKVIMA